MHDNFSFITPNGVRLTKSEFIDWIKSSNSNPKSKRYQSTYSIDAKSVQLVNELNNDNYILSCRINVNPTFKAAFLTNNAIDSFDRLPMILKVLLASNNFKMTIIISDDQVRFSHVLFTDSSVINR